MSLQPIERWAGEAPGFNRPVADAVYTTIMKMAPDEAVMFTRMIADAVLQDDLLVHGQLLAKAVLDERAQRVATLKKRLAGTAVAKARAGQNADAELLALQEISKSFLGDLFSSDKRSERARKQQRGAGTGQFVRETHDIVPEGDRPHSEAAENRLNIPTPPAGWNLSDKERAAYQQAYHQVAALIAPYKRLPHGTALVHLITDSGKDTVTTIPTGAGTLDPKHFDPRNGGAIRQMKISVIPPADEKGAYFSILDALGLPGAGAVAAGATEGGALDPNRLQSFGDKLHQSHPTDEFAPSQKVFRRVHASSQLIQDTLGNAAPPQAQMALKTAQHVASLGPKVQNVVGPTMDRAAYRYRGTERKPAPELLTALDADNVTAAQRVRLGQDSTREVNDSQTMRDQRLRTNARIHEEQGATIRRRWAQAAQDRQAGLLDRNQLKFQTKRAQRDLALVDAHRVAADKKAHADHAAVLSQHEGRLAQAQRDHTAMASSIVARGYKGDDDRWKSGQALAYFKSRLPSASLNELHLQAGTLPPSEGVILDSNGKVASQAVGYGEDHYLPFTLGGLRKLRGGSYIRTRTWGGPTPEDIRTSLLGGAKSLTVVSNNGVFNVEFDPTFKGGRRHNDKAHRMIGRYEHLLDALKSESVSRAGIDPGVLEALEARAASKANPQRNPEGYNLELNRLKAEQRKNPVMSTAQRNEAATEYIRELATSFGTKGAETTPEELVNEIATRSAAATVKAYATEYNKFLSRNPSPAEVDRVPVPPSLEVVRQQELDKLRSDDPQTAAANIAATLHKTPGLEAHMRQAEQTNRTNMARLRLDGTGYEAALGALREQFPYYIKSTTFQPWEHAAQRADTGYVRPGALRPGQAKAGLTDSPNSGGKVRADTIRGQNHGNVMAATAAVPVAAGVAGAVATPPPVSEESASAVRERVDINMMRALLAQKTFGPNATLNGNKIADAHIADTLNDPKVSAPPAALVPFYVGDVSESKLLDEYEANPTAMHDKIAKAVSWFKDNDAFPDSAEHAAILKDFETGGRVSSVSDETNPARILRRPEREYRFAHDQGEEYVPGSGADSEAIQKAYLQDQAISPLVAAKELPATVDAPDFTERRDALLTKLRDREQANADWTRNARGIGDMPYDEGDLDNNVRGVIQADTLHRRYAESEKLADIAFKAKNEQAQADFAAEQAHAPVLDMSLWGPEQFAQLADDPDLAARTRAGLEAMGLNMDPNANRRADAAEALVNRRGVGG